MQYNSESKYRQTFIDISYFTNRNIVNAHELHFGAFLSKAIEYLCICYSPSTMDSKIPDIINLKKEEALIFAHSLKGRALASGPNDKCAITEAHGVSTCREGMRN